jgi:hypothetical protein
MLTGCMSATCESSVLRFTHGSILIACRCGLTAIANLKKQSFECRACKNKTNVSQLYIPYAAKLLFQVREFALV